MTVFSFHTCHFTEIMKSLLKEPLVQSDIFKNFKHLERKKAFWGKQCASVLFNVINNSHLFDSLRTLT